MSESEIESPDVDAIMLDGAAIVNIMKPRSCKTFEATLSTFSFPILTIT